MFVYWLMNYLKALKLPKMPDTAISPKHNHAIAIHHFESQQAMLIITANESCTGSFQQTVILSTWMDIFIAMSS